MKRFFSGLLVGAMLMSSIAFATGSKLEVNLQSLSFIINGKQTQQTGFIHEGRAYVPVRYVSESLGKEVVWDAKTGTITVDEKTPVSYENGTYRGTYEDGGIQQVSIQFKIENDVIKDLSFRHLAYKDVDYNQLKEGDKLYPVLKQHQQILTYLDGKPLSAISALYKPGDFVDNIDTFTGATIRGSKIYSAIQDGLNRGAYTPAGEANRNIPAYENGTYRGVFLDGGVQQVSIQFNLENNIIKSPTFRHLAYKGVDYRELKEGDRLYPVWVQHKQILEYLDGKPLETSFDLHKTENFIADIDTFTGATIRGNKVLSAFRDGLNRGIYTPANNNFSKAVRVYPNGRYRGTFSDGGVQQVSIEFNLENNVIKSLSYRHLSYRGTDYRQLKEGDRLFPVWEQHKQLLAHLEDQPLEVIFDLYTPGAFIDNIDTFTGATVRANKVLSAIRDGLNRGIY